MTAEPDPSRYSEALEQQLALVRHLMSPLGLSDGQRDDAGLHLHRGRLPPCPIGFVWFEEPVPLDAREPSAQRLHAISWRVGARPEGAGVTCLLNGWLVSKGRPGVVLRVRESVEMGWTLEQARRAAGETLSVVPGATEPSPAEAVLVEVFLRFTAGCLSFLEQRIAVAERRPPHRPLRSRLEREQYRGETTIGVIALRRREYERLERSRLNIVHGSGYTSADVRPMLCKPHAVAGLSRP